MPIESISAPVHGSHPIRLNRLTRLTRPRSATGRGRGPAGAVLAGRALLRRYRAVVLISDAVVGGVMAALAVVLRFDSVPTGWYAVVPAMMPLAWVTVLTLNRAYDERFAGCGTEEFNRVLRSGLALFTSIAVFSFLVVDTVSRSIVLASVPGAVAGSLLVRKLARVGLHHARRQGHGLAPTLIVGHPEAAEHLVELLEAVPSEGLRPVGVCLPDTSPHQDWVLDVPVVGSTQDVLAAVDELEATAVAVVSHPELAGHPLRQLSWALEERNAELLVSPGIVEVAGPRLSIRPVAGLSLLHLEKPAARGGSMILKSAMDRTIAALTLLVLAPVLLLIAVLIRVTSHGPALFRQTRVGVDGREFSILKFRSMVPDAERMLIDLRSQDEGNGVLFKLRADPRVTRIGAVLRRFSLDELPQLVNVLKGEMSLVGPRPPLPSEVAGYEPDAARRLRVRPGITGLWQVSGRSDLTWEESLRLDLRYVDNWSMALDISILWRTIRAVARGRGAY